MRSRCLPALLLLLTAAAPAPATEETVEAVIEIPAGSDVKYERDAAGRIFVDRFLPLPVAYPANYGAIPGTLAGDGDELDVLVHTRRPIAPGAFIRVRPIGILRMRDVGEADDKIIAVPAPGVDPAYNHMRSIDDLPEAERTRIAAFFRLYKQAPDGRSPISLSGFGDAAEARAMLQAATARATGR